MSDLVDPSTVFEPFQTLLFKASKCFESRLWGCWSQHQGEFATTQTLTGPLCRGPLQRTPLGLAHLWWVGSEDVGRPWAWSKGWVQGETIHRCGPCIGSEMDVLAVKPMFFSMIFQIDVSFMLGYVLGACCYHCNGRILLNVLVWMFWSSFEMGAHCSRTMQLMVQCVVYSST